jgi:hypothetical protein
VAPEGCSSSGRLLALSFNKPAETPWDRVQAAVVRYRTQGLLLLAGLSVSQAIVHMVMVVSVVALSVKIPNIAILIPIATTIEFFVLESANIYQVFLLFGLVALLLSAA